MNLVEYMKGKDPLEKREAILFDLLNELERETFALFDDAVDLNSESLYKLAVLMNRCNFLKIKYNDITESYVYINSIEQSSYFYAAKRYELKMLLTMMVTAYTFLLNSLLGILSYVALSTSAKNYYLYELDYIRDNLQRFDDTKIRKIGQTLDNSIRMIDGKFNRLIDGLKEDPSLRQKIIFENNFIISLLEGTKTIDDYNKLDDDVKEGIIRILKNDLNSDSNDIHELYKLLIDDEKIVDNLKLTLS